MNTTIRTRPEPKNEECRSHHQRGNPHKSSSATPTMSSITHKSENTGQSKQADEKVPPKRSNFTMLPNSIIDADISESCFTGFVRFLRHFGRVGVFTGSERKLSKVLKLARQTVKKIIDEWVKSGWIIRTTRPKPYEDGGEVMCLILCDLWQSGTNVDQDGAETTGEESSDTRSDNVDEPEKGDEDTGLNVYQGGTNVYHPGKEVDQSGQSLDQAGSLLVQSGKPDTLKVEGNIGSNTDSNTLSKKGGNIGATPQKEKNTGPLPSLPPSSSFSEFPFEEIGDDTPHCWQAIASIATHYLGGAKVSQVDAEALAQKMQSYAGLVGAQEARRRIVEGITFMVYSDAPSNWFRGEKRKQLSLRNVATFWEDYSRKVQEANWTPPGDKVPAWYAPTDVAPAQEEYLSGMTEAEVNRLADEIESQYPGMKMSLGHLPDDHYTLGLWINDDAWLDLFSPEDWRNPPECLKEYHLKWALEAYEQYAGVPA